MSFLLLLCSCGTKDIQTKIEYQKVYVPSYLFEPIQPNLELVEGSKVSNFDELAQALVMSLNLCNEQKQTIRGLVNER